MKVMQILPSLEVGGVERGVIDLAKAFKKRREELVVVSSGGRLVTELHKLGVTHYTLPVHRKAPATISMIPKLIEIIRRERIDVVHARSRVPAWIAWAAARWTGVPFVTTCHGYYAHHPLSKIMGWGKAVIVISKIIGRHMIDDFRVAPEKIRLVYRGIDMSEFEFTPPESKKKNEIFRIINVGRLSPIKGQLEFIKAIHLLKHRFSKIEVLLVGGELKGKTKYTEQLEAAIRQFGLESTVKLLGTRSDIAELIRGSDLLVLSTLVPEAFGRVVVEAGAVGTPVISTRVGGVLEIIDDGKNGFLVTPGDPEAMAGAMARLIKDKDLRAEFSRNLRKKVEEEFTLEKMADNTLAVYKEVLAKKRILIIKLGAMGDLILGTPSFRMIRNRFPDAHIALLVDRQLASLVSSCPHLNEVFPVERKKLSNLTYLFKIAKTLRREGYEIAVDLQNSKWTHLLAALAGIPARYGFRRGRLGFLINRHDRGFELAEAPVRNQFRILSKLGIATMDEELELWPSAESEEKISRIFDEAKANDSLRVGFAMGASPKWATKRWPAEYYKELAKQLIQSQGCRIALIGSREDEQQVKEWVGGDSEHFINFVGQTSLSDLVSVVKRLDVLITGDTAPLHIAAAVKTRFIALFGPTDPKRHAPPASGSQVITRHLSCQPCYDGECRNKETLACLRKISVEEVYDSVVRQLVS